MTFVDGRDFERFNNLVRTQFRFCLPTEYREMMKAITESAASRVKDVPEGNSLWRAQLGMAPATETARDDGSVVIQFNAHPPERMKPILGLPVEGRANPQGLPVLYMSTDPNTAMTEVRPNLASVISLAILKTNRPLRIVDCEMSNSTWSAFDARPIPEEEREGVVWGSINDAFVRPVDPEVAAAQYLATQMVAEHLKVAGYDGVKYRTGYDTGGSNVALFDLDAADVKLVTLQRMRSASFTFGTF